MTSLALTLLLMAPAGDPTPESSKPVGQTRDAEKELLEKHKQAKPRLPMPPQEAFKAGQVNNGTFRAYYIPAELRETPGGFGRDADPAMTLDNTFKVKLFWIASRANNCYYCLGHQEYKLLGAGVSDNDIAALDGDWHDATEKERVAYAFTKKLAHTPHLIQASDVEALKKHYTPQQALEILVTVAGYNSTNRWTDGLNIPAETDGTRFKKENGKADFSTFKTPTAENYKKQQTCVGPVAIPLRAALEPRDKVEELLKQKREALLPLADAKIMATLWEGDHPPAWASLLGTFPKAMKGRIAGLKTSMEKGQLSAKLKAEIAWVAARQDRAWYALSIAGERLNQAGVSQDARWKLDGDRKDLPEAEQAALALAETLTSAPWRVTEEMVERCRKSFKDSEVAEIVHHTCQAAFFNRVTEVARLPFDR